MKSFLMRLDRRVPAGLLGALAGLYLGIGSAPAPGSPGSWTRKADMPEVRLAAASGEIDGILYVAAGNTAPLALPKPKTLFAYDSRTDVWSRKADIPTERELAASGVVDGILYVAGGLVGADAPSVTGVVEAYDPKTDTWTKKASLRIARGAVTGCVLDGLLYAIGGATPSGLVSTVEAYDPKTDQWTAKASLPVVAEVPAVQVYDGHIYVFVDQQTFSYDPAVNRWTPRKNLPAGEYRVLGTIAGTVDGLMYLFGGLQRPSLCSSDAGLAYNPIADRYTDLPPMPFPTGRAATAVLSGKVYVAGGASGAAPDCPGAVTRSSLWVYDPAGTAPPPGTWTRKADMPEVRLGAAAGEIDGILYVAAGNIAPLAQPQPKTLFAYNPVTDAWSRKADIPTGRELAASGVVDGILYVAGGLVGANAPSVTAVVEAYDPRTDTWTKKASLRIARGDVTGCVLDGLFYAIGGVSSSELLSTVECYDPKTDQWTTKAPLPVVAEVPAVQVFDGRIYVFVDQQAFAYDPAADRWTARASLPAGSLQARLTAAATVDGWIYLMGGMLRPSLCGSDAVLAYNPIADRYTELPPMPTPTIAPASVVLGGKVYLAGSASGVAPDCPGAVTHPSLWVYDPAGTAPPPGTWTRKADMPENRAGTAVGEIEGVLYVAAGNIAPLAQPQPKALFAYDPRTDAWSRKADIPTGRELAASGVVDGILYVAGGLVGADPTVMTGVVEAYDPKTDTWTKKASMRTARGDVTGCVLDGLFYAIGGVSSSGFLSTVECYDPKTDQWTTKAHLPVVAEVPAVQVFDGRIYVFVDQQAFAYDPTADCWTARANLPAGTLQARLTAAGTVDGWIYLMGGMLRPSVCSSDGVLAYDPVSDRYTSMSLMPGPTSGAASAVLDGKVYVAGGGTGFPPDCPGGVIGKSLWVYAPERAEAPTLLELSAESADQIRMTWRGQVGRRYGLETTTWLHSGAWARCATSGGTTILAAQSVVDVTVPVSSADRVRFFRVIVID